MTDIKDNDHREVIAPGALQPGTVPLTFNGIVVGSATVDKDGVVTQVLWDGKEPIDVEHVGGDILMPKPKYNIVIENSSNFQINGIPDAVRHEVFRKGHRI